MRTRRAAWSCIAVGASARGGEPAAVVEPSATQGAERTVGEAELMEAAPAEPAPEADGGISTRVHSVNVGEEREIARAVYSTGLDGTLIVSADADGEFVVAEAAP